MSSFLKEVWPISLFFQLPSPEPIVPEYEDPAGLTKGDYIYNPEFYATKETAEKIMKRFTAQSMYCKPVMDGDEVAPPQWFVRFSDGLEVNAGTIAKFYAMYPEKKHPQIATRFAINLIGMLRMARNAERQMGD